MKKVVFACLVTLTCTGSAIVQCKAADSVSAAGAPTSGSSPSPSEEPQLRGVQNPSSLPKAIPAAKPYWTTLPETAPAPALQGTARITDMSATAKSLSICPLARNRDKNLKYVEVKIKNEGQNIAVILGNAAHADMNDEKLPPAAASQVELSDRPRLSGTGKLAVATVSLASLGLAGPIFYELLTPDQHSKRYLGTAIGRDGSRHEVEARHFGIRVMMPGDEETGWFAFYCPPEGVLKDLIIPVSYTKSGVPAGTLSVNVDSK